MTNTAKAMKARRGARKRELNRLLLKERTDRVVDKVGSFIVNELGINMCSVTEISVARQCDGQITSINIIFEPANDPKSEE